MCRKKLALFISVLAFCIYFPIVAFAKGIVVFGDSQAEEGHRKVVSAVEKVKPEIIFRVGDLVDDGEDPAQWKLFNEIEANLLKSTEYFPVLGNHEKNSPLYFKNFKIPNNGHWYSVDREGVHFIVLDSNSDLSAGSEQYQWLVSDFRSIPASSRFRIVLFHQPLFSASKAHGDDEKHIGGFLLPLFKEYNVNLVLNGHVHCYQRFFFDGINFITTGGGGSHLVDVDKPNPYLRFSAKTYHFCTLEVKGDVLQVRCFDPALNLIEELDIPNTNVAHPQEHLEEAVR
ncbi:MAG: metallophosphoesterase [Candidatus Omnitrophica bacterium]|nr:metallophosphoesterase [Candidatus Omnitrophota bacterium]